MAQKHLTFYELDLGLNTVVRKWSEPVDNGANLLIAVPGGGDGPGGVLVSSCPKFMIQRTSFVSLQYSGFEGCWASCEGYNTQFAPNFIISVRG